MLKTNKKLKFIKDIDRVKDIFNSFIESNEELGNIKVKHGHYIVEVKEIYTNLTKYVQSTAKYSLENDFEIISGSTLDSLFATTKLREFQTKAEGKKYVVALEKFLNEQTEKEVSNYRKLLEDEAE